MTEWLLDASALLAYIKREPGGDIAGEAIADGAAISAANLAEVVSKLLGNGMPPEVVTASLRVLKVPVIAVDEAVALAAGTRHAIARPRGFSLADAICIETARLTHRTAVTADRAWGDLDVDVPVSLIR